MKKTISFLAASSLLLTALPAFAQSDNAPEIASAEKCAELSGREKLRCMKNNLRMRRHDIRVKHRAKRTELRRAQQEEFSTRRDQWRKSRAALRAECRIQVREIGNGERLEFIKQCHDERRELRREQREARAEFLETLRVDRQSLGLNQRHARRAFRYNAKQQMDERRRLFLRTRHERPTYERVFTEEEIMDVEEEEETEEEGTEE